MNKFNYHSPKQIRTGYSTLISYESSFSHSPDRMDYIVVHENCPPISWVSVSSNDEISVGFEDGREDILDVLKEEELIFGFASSYQEAEDQYIF